MRKTKSIELKAEVTHAFLKTVSAYSNYGSGIIYFGINDDGSIKGIDCPKVKCLDIENLINANIDQKPDYTLEIDEKTNVITSTNSQETEEDTQINEPTGSQESDTSDMNDASNEEMQ